MTLKSQQAQARQKFDEEFNLKDVEGCDLTPGLKEFIDTVVADTWKSRDAEVIMLRADLAHAIGYCQGLGYPESYLEKRHPDLMSSSPDRSSEE